MDQTGNAGERRGGKSLRILWIAVLIAVVAVGWLVLDEAGRPVEPPAPDGVGHGSGPTREVDEATAAGLRGAGTAKAGPAQEPLPGPVDIESADRLLDLHGIVVDQQSQPVSGVALQTVTYPWRRGGLLTDGLFEVEKLGPATRSARDGTFALRLGPGQVVHLRAAKATFARIEVPHVQAGERLRVELAPATRLLISTTTLEGGPAADVRVRLFRTGRRTDVSFKREGTTDAEGRLVFEGLPGGVVGMLALKHARLGNPTWQQVALAAEGDTTFEFTMPRGRRLCGRVTAAETGEPVVGAKVGMNWFADPFVLTNEDGRYELHGWTGEGVQGIAVVAAGYARANRKVGAEDEYDVVLQRGVRGVGRVLGKNDQPVAGAQVAAIGSMRAADGRVVSFDATTSREDGSFSVNDLSPLMPHTLVLMAPGYGRTLLDFDVTGISADGPIDLGDVRIHGARTLAGVLVDDRGEPCPRVHIELRGANADRGRLRSPSGAPAQTFYGNRGDRATDDLGRFRFPGLAPGTYELTARPTGAAHVGESVVIPEGEDVTDVRLVAPSGRTLRVRVLKPDGAPVVAAYVYVRDSGTGRAARAQTNAEGSADLVVDRETTIRVSLPRARYGYLKPQPRQVGADVEEVIFKLGRAGMATGHIVDPAGDPIALASIEVHRDGKRIGSCWADEQGAFSAEFPFDAAIAVVFAGRVQVPMSAGVRTIKTLPMKGRLGRVRDGVRDVVLRTTAAAADQSIVILALKPDGTPLKDARVMLHPSVSKGARRTDANGECEIEGLMATRLTIEVVFRAPDGEAWLQAKQVELIPNGQRLVFRARLGAFLRGIVRLPDGMPAVRASVQLRLRWGATFFAAADTDAEGRFTLSVDPDLRDLRLAAHHSPAGTGIALQAVVEQVDPGDEVALQLAQPK